MNKQQRKDWDYYIEETLEAKKTASVVLPTAFDRDAIVAANAYILKLERELQNIKQGKKIAAILTKGNNAISQ